MFIFWPCSEPYTQASNKRITWGCKNFHKRKKQNKQKQRNNNWQEFKIELKISDI